MSFSVFMNKQGRLRNLWWVAVFFLVLSAILFPCILLSQRYGFEITISHQALIVVAASLICQLLRKEPLSDLFGAFNLRWIKDFLWGLFMGALLMLVPALLLYVTGAVSWHINPVDVSKLLSITLLFVAVAVAEEVLFRGFIFQRLISALGNWPAQLIMAAYFLLIHINNPGMTGTIKLIAGINIFLASVMFGLAFIQTKSLAMPMGLHFMANWVQGVLLGFGVSGNAAESFLKPILNGAPDWITGGSFGLEASIPGLIAVVISIVLLYRWKPAKNNNN